MALNIVKYRVVMELLEPMLGTVPKQKEVYANYILSKSRELMEKDGGKGIALADGSEPTKEGIEEKMVEEVETIEDIEERGWTGFHTDNDGPFLYDYAVKGFLSESGRTLKQWSPDGDTDEEDEDDEEEEKPKKGKTKKNVIKQLQDKIKRYVFVMPRRIRLPKTNGCLERPLRAQTAKGPRVTVTRSDMVDAGTKITFDLHVLHGGQISEGLLKDVLDYANYQGFGQWRGGGYGRAEVKEFKRLK